MQNQESLKSEIYNDVSKMYKQRVGISRIQATLIKNFETDVPLELIKEICNEIKNNKETISEIKQGISSKEMEKKDGGLKDFVADIGEKRQYDYVEETDHIVFYPDGKPYPVLRTTVQAMFEKYVKQGENLSGKQMQIEFELSAKAWNYIKGVMNLMKDATPFDKITLSKFESVEDMERAAQEKADRLTEGKMKRVFSNAEQLAKDNLFRTMSKDVGWADKKLDAILVAAKKHRPIEFGEIKTMLKSNNKTKDVFISDAHLGKKDTDGIVVRFKKLTRELIECEETDINITFGGDLGEQFVAWGEKHPGTKLGMEDIDLEELFMLILDVFEEMLLAIYKSGKHVIFNGLGGNHDSFESNKDFDPNRSPAMIIYRLLDKILKDTTIKVNILREKYNIVKKGNIKFIYAHGDNVSAATVNRIAMNYLEDGYYLIIVTGDKHHFESHEITDRIMRVQSPALAGKGKYDESLAMSSQPGAIFFEKNRDGMVDIILKRYK